MDILHKDNGKNGMFYVEENGEVLAEMTYVWSGADKLIIDHTGVSEVLKGKGVGKLLVKSAVDMARDKHVKILPVCPFAKSEFEKNPAYNDVLF